MKIAIAAANYVGHNLVDYLTQANHDIEFAITCENDKYEERIHEALESSGIENYRNSDINSATYSYMMLL